jgi:predicted nucleic acid-binding protein
MAREFLDSNILVYAFVDDPRAVTAEAILARRCETSVQTLSEFANVARRKLGMGWSELNEALMAIRTLCGTIHPIDLETHQHALKLAESHGFSIFDALIVATALKAGCTILHTEDMQDGQIIENRLKISNPFKKN